MPRVQGRTGVACAPHLKYRCGVPSLVGRLRGSVQGPFSLPLSLLRSKARGSPSVTRPFDGMTVHWTVIFARLTPVPGANAGYPSPATSCLHFALPPPSALSLIHISEATRPY